MAPRKVVPADMIVLEEPLEAQPPPGVVLEEPAQLQEASDAEMALLIAAAQIANAAPEVDTEEDVPDATLAAPPVLALPTVGDYVSFVLDRDIIQTMEKDGVPVNTLCLGDVAPAVVIKINESGSVNLRVFVDAEALPLVRNVSQMFRPAEVTLDHTRSFFQ